MKARHINNRTIVYEAGQSFKLDEESPLPTSLHCHAEYELVHVRSGHGKEFVGDNVREYHADDLIFIGTNLPHLYLSASQEPEENRCEILQFPKEIFPEKISEIPEYRSIHELLDNSSWGILFLSAETKKDALAILVSMKKCRGMERLMLLLRLLNRLGNSRQYCLLSTLKYTNPLQEYVTDDPTGKIYGYLVNNYRQNVSIEDIAAHVRMNPHSICRYFKQKTGKTLFQCIAEIRVEHACKLLANSDLTISQIAWNSGFGNQAHFNKQFKAVTGQTPSEYRKAFKDETNLT